MKKLVQKFKSLPPEVRTLLAMAGLGTPFGILFFLQRYVFKGVSLLVLIIGLVIVVAVLGLVAWLVSRMFGRSAKRRQRKMESDLASGAESGQVAMSLRASVKANNEKFFTAIKDMRKLGISVYDLPWYVVIGDSGCGKTKLINEGGLTFSTGKPEGYQLGTLNYNWWFTEDAIFVDMAGRLCNPQDDTDYREWEAFLNTVGQGRKGYPINGVLLCISAEHLLQDSPEKHEADANTMLERLRDLQSKLGVTFATYLIITKCDKIVGFMPFFDRAERDITIKNQIFGFSRSGSFSELYDPERFGADFADVYARLNELRLRRLNDDADEHELGLAYSFPEEFRELKEPLQTYVRTLFPMIKNPRAVKNLIFRGVYFTSATQQGGLILRHLTQRLGEDAARQFQPLESLYPRPRPHFVKELLFRKVFPEYGLVFRNEQEVVRNRKLARALMISSGVLAVVLLVVLVISALRFGRLVAEPRVRAELACNFVAKPPEALARVGELRADVSLLRSSVWPTILSLGIGAQKPAQDLTRIQVGLFENAVLQPVLAATDEALRTVHITPDADAGPGTARFEDYLAALEAYLTWCGCASSKTLPDCLDYSSFEHLCGITPASPIPLLDHRDELLDQARDYFLTVQSLDEPANPARFLKRTGFDPQVTIRAALATVHTYAKHELLLSETSADLDIRSWMRVRNRCATIADAYAAMLGAGDQRIATEEQLNTFQETFSDNHAALVQAMQECTWEGQYVERGMRIPSLRDALRRQRQHWLNIQSGLLAAYDECQGDAGDAATRRLITGLMDGDAADLPGLNHELYQNIVAAGLASTSVPYRPELFEDEAFTQFVREVYDAEAFGYIVALKRDANGMQRDALELAPALQQVVRPVLDKVREQLGRLGSGGLQAETAAEWVNALGDLLYPKEDATTNAPPGNMSNLDPRWRSPELLRLNDTYLDLLRKGRGTVLLRTVATRLQAAQTVGFGELGPDWRVTQSSAYLVPVPALTAPVSEPERTAAPPPVTHTPTRPPPLVTKPPVESGLPPTTPPATAAPASPSPVGTGTIPRYASAEYFNARAMECVQLLRFLVDFGPEHYFSSATAASPLNEHCSRLTEAAWEQYCRQYVHSLNTAYTSKTLPALERLSRWDAGWETFARQFEPTRGTGSNVARDSVRDELLPALAEILHDVRWATHSPESGNLMAYIDDHYRAQARIVTDALADAIDREWSAGDFVRRAAPSGALANAPRPWAVLADDCGARWSAWCDAVGGAAHLPRKFDTEDARAKPQEIPWAALGALRIDTGMGDEQLTGQVISFQEHALRLLSIELSSILYAVQKDYFVDQQAYDGWPYVNGEGTGEGATDTVDYGQFVRFLQAVQRADTLFAIYEKGIPEDDAHGRERRAFFRACRDWREFLSLTSQGGATPLEVSVWTEDPLGEPYGKDRVDDSGQHFYEQVCLNIGLRLQGTSDQSVGQGVCFPTSAEARARHVATVWEWTRVPELQVLEFALVSGVTPEGKSYQFPELKPKALGKPSPLAFCAYLHRYGVYDEGNWIASHALDLQKKFAEANRPDLVQELRADEHLIGEKFIFQLPSGRRLPDAIPVLRPAGGASGATP